ncbi:unnamed protein product [Rhizoctonia solani]|uniref:Uncharacterized protein n=1 Tax=Rhizoctonia solani TaxID=456999 RepID=A0A8H3BJC9_9AGAM|nr:unnamed protein product [Rhizoctonia solani]
MSHLPEHMFSTIPEALQNPGPVDLEPQFIIHEWTPNESFSVWIKGVYDTNKERLPYVFSSQLSKAVGFTVKYEESLESLTEDDWNHINHGPFFLYQGYKCAFSSIITYISRLLPEEQEDSFIATLTRSFDKRLKVAHEIDVNQTKGGFC